MVIVAVGTIAAASLLNAVGSTTNPLFDVPFWWHFVTFYEHKETPGLGGEVDNPRWRVLWTGRRAFGEDNEPRIRRNRPKRRRA